MKTKFLYLSVALGLTVTSCKKVDYDEHTHEDPTTLQLKVNHKIGNETFSMDSTYTDGFGNNYKFTFVNVYLSNFKVGNASSETKYLLVNPSQTSFNLGEIEHNDISTFDFLLGVDSVTNHTDPATYEPTHPLAYQSPTMHWNWNSGYIFYKLEGVVDTNQDNTFDQTFAFHIGMDNLAKPISLNSAINLVANVENSIEISIDYAKFLTNVNLKTENETHTLNNMPLAMKIADNGLTVFSAQ